jgi:hypothetical protein
VLPRPLVKSKEPPDIDEGYKKGTFSYHLFEAAILFRPA